MPKSGEEKDRTTGVEVSIGVEGKPTTAETTSESEVEMGGFDDAIATEKARERRLIGIEAGDDLIPFACCDLDSR